jgi:hypothetical protein
VNEGEEVVSVKLCRCDLGRTSREGQPTEATAKHPNMDIGQSIEQRKSSHSSTRNILLYTVQYTSCTAGIQNKRQSAAGLDQPLDGTFLYLLLLLLSSQCVFAHTARALAIGRRSCSTSPSNSANCEYSSPNEIRKRREHTQRSRPCHKPLLRCANAFSLFEATVFSLSLSLSLSDYCATTKGQTTFVVVPD